MSTLKVQNLQHPDASAPAITLASDGTATVAGAGGGGGLGGEQYLFVAGDGTAAANGAELVAAYAEAQTMTPYGNPLSATNRVTVLVAPGDYAIGNAWAVDADFVNVLSLDGTRSIRLLSDDGETGDGFFDFVPTGIEVTADNAHLRGIDVGTNRFGGCSGPTLDGADDLLVENCAGGNRSFGTAAVSATDSHFLSGTFVDCAGGDLSFASSGTASGTFTNCTAGDDSFGSDNGVASGTFTNCTATNFSFGGFGSTASGTFTNCTADVESFGVGFEASGTFTNCIGGQDSFGQFGSLTGFVLYCRLTSGGFASPQSGGVIRFSLDGNFTEMSVG